MASGALTDSRLTDRNWIARGEERTSLRRFLLWLAPWVALLAVGVYAAGLCLYFGLNQTNMDNRFAFGLWIFLDLGVIALGAGAFFTGFLVYILNRAELKPILNTAVVVGFICYSGAVAILMIDVGQPLRAWFTFWHPNTHSMLTEVTFCISCYLLVLCLEYIPILLRNRQLRKLPSFLVFEHQLHKLVPVLAGVGTLLSFFHQGSLGGLYGVLRGRPFAFRDGVFIWPSTFFLFILSAIATGPSFLMLVAATVEKVTASAPGAGGPISATRIYFRIAACDLRRRQVDRHADLVELHISIRWICPLAVLHAQAVRDTDPLYRNCALRAAPGISAHLSQNRGAAGMAAERGRLGMRWGSVEPFRSHRPDAGGAYTGIRRVSAIHAELAGGCQLRWSDCLRGYRLLTVVSLPALVHAVKRRE